jgi:hypothetical protein
MSGDWETMALYLGSMEENGRGAEQRVPDAIWIAQRYRKCGVVQNERKRGA